MIDGREELMDVTFEAKAGPRPVAAHAPEHPIQGVHCFVCPFAFPAGEGMGNERRLENGVEHGEYRVVEDTVPDCSFVDAPLLGIADNEGAVRLMPVGSSHKPPVQTKKILFQLSLELLHILPSLLPFAELLPRSEKVFLGNDALEEVSVYLHCCILPVCLSGFCRVCTIDRNILW